MSKKSFLVSLLSIFSLFSCAQKNEEQQLDELQIKIENLKASMISYMDDAKPPYSEKDVEKCKAILIDHIDEIAKTNSKEHAMKIVKSTVLKLNELNDNCQGQLIETGEREQIAEIIIIAGNKKGYNALDEDITEEWREW